MQKEAAPMTLELMQRATRRASSIVESTLRRAKRMKDDTDRERRQAQHHCVACFYEEGIAGAAMTYRPCMCCGSNELYGSTNTDALCLACAKEHLLCRHCGGDIGMNMKRKTWPSMKAPA